MKKAEIDRQSLWGAVFARPSSISLKFLYSSKYKNILRLFHSLPFSSKMWKLRIINCSRCKSHFFWYWNTIFINFRPQFRHRQNAVGLGLGDHVSTPLSLLTATINVSFPDRATKPSAEIQTFLIAILAFYSAFGVTLWYNYFRYLFIVFSCFLWSERPKKGNWKI